MKPAEQALYAAVEQRLPVDQRRWLDDLLGSDLPARQTRYTMLKRSAKKASRQPPRPTAGTADLAGVAGRQRHLARRRSRHPNEAPVQDGLGDGHRRNDGRDGAEALQLTLALIRQMRVRACDDIAEIFIRRMGACHNAAKEEPQQIGARQRGLSGELVAKLEEGSSCWAQDLDDVEIGQRVRKPLAPVMAAWSNFRRTARRPRSERNEQSAAAAEDLQQLAGAVVSDGARPVLPLDRRG
jgi:hypothetical protein